MSAPFLCLKISFGTRHRVEIRKAYSLRSALMHDRIEERKAGLFVSSRAAPDLVHSKSAHDLRLSQAECCRLLTDLEEALRDMDGVGKILRLMGEPSHRVSIEPILFHYLASRLSEHHQRTYAAFDALHSLMATGGQQISD
jgi:hypothetical protein